MMSTDFDFFLQNLLGVLSFTGSALCIHGRMKTRIVYSRDFLLSFGELEHCKKLPTGFDTALLRSF
jgi:hypothetical protein